ncbi:MAG: hypothetical protein EON85_08670 [Brevundimonas sp.]|nr:MAG: hypothetical protein EON85_08670 [Brevundimonas sp.]
MSASPVCVIFMLYCLGIAGCGEGERAPFRADVGGLTINLPQRADLYQAVRHDTFVSVRVCNREQTAGRPVRGCERISSPLVNQYGVLVLISEASPEESALLSQRPDRQPPLPEELIDLQQGGDDRLRIPDPDQPLQTTINGWPKGRCGTAPQGHRYCRVGFLIDRAVVDAQWHAEDDAELNQAEVWAVASAVESKIRALTPASP